MIGVTLQEIDTETAKGLGLPDARGALINDVSPGSAGDKAGLRIGDVVRSIDGTQIRQSSDLPPIVGAMAPGTKTTPGIQIGRASSRERVCQSVKIQVIAVTSKKKYHPTQQNKN